MKIRIRLRYKPRVHMQHTCLWYTKGSFRCSVFFEQGIEVRSLVTFFSFLFFCFKVRKQKEGKSNIELLNLGCNPLGSGVTSVRTWSLSGEGIQWGLHTMPHSTSWGVGFFLPGSGPSTLPGSDSSSHVCSHLTPSISWFCYHHRGRNYSLQSSTLFLSPITL